MYLNRITHIPHPGKGQELRAALEERSKTANAAGGSYNLTQRLFTKEPAFVHGLRYESLADLDAYQTSAPNDPVRQAQIAKIQSLCTLESELCQVLVMGTAATDPHYGLQITNYPIPGKEAELRKLLEDYAKTPSKGVLGKNVRVSVASPDGPNFTLAVTFASLAGLEEMRAATPADSVFQAFSAARAPLEAA